MSDAKRKVSAIVNQLKAYNPEKVILFGSYAHGNPGKDSDIDLVLIKKTGDPFNQRLKKVHLLLKTKTPVDVFVFTPDEFARGIKTNPFIKEVAEYGKIVYE